MNQACIKVFTIVCLNFVLSTCFGQFNSFKQEDVFLRHLAKEQLFNERIFLLSNLKDSSFATLINLETAWTYHAVHDLQASQALYEKLPFDSLIKYNFHLDYISLLFKKNETGKIKSLLDSSLSTNKLDPRMTVGIKLTNLEFSIQEAKKMDLNNELLDIYTGAVRIDGKSAALAGLYSAALPGLGKMYYGKRKQALNAFAACLIFGLQSYESYVKAGPESFRFVFFTTGFSFFYLSNIYGTIRGLVKEKKDRKKQLYYEVGNNYFNTNRTVHPRYN